MDADAKQTAAADEASAAEQTEAQAEPTEPAVEDDRSERGLTMGPKTVPGEEMEEPET